MTRQFSYTTTERWKNRVNVWDDPRHARFQVYRRVGEVYRKTSVRYGQKRCKAQARELAHLIAERLRVVAQNPKMLAKFSFQ